VREWFAELAGVAHPGRKHLHDFLAEVMRLLEHALRSEESNLLWSEYPGLRDLALVAYETDILGSASELDAAIDEIPEGELIRHGLVGNSARFKFNVIAAVSKAWNNLAGRFSIRAGFRRVIEAVDVPLGSLVDAAGTGGAIKEFKDALLALAPDE